MQEKQSPWSQLKINSSSSWDFHWKRCGNRWLEGQWYWVLIFKTMFLYLDHIRLLHKMIFTTWGLQCLQEPSIRCIHLSFLLSRFCSGDNSEHLFVAFSHHFHLIQISKLLLGRTSPQEHHRILNSLLEFLNDLIWLQDGKADHDHDLFLIDSSYQEDQMSIFYHVLGTQLA